MAFIFRNSGMWEATKTECLIRVAPYFRFAVEPGAATSEMAPAQSADLSVTITNFGNAVDSYKLQIENRNELEQKGWNITISQDSLTKMYPAETRTVRISARAPTDWAPWKSETTIIRLNVSSVNAPDFGMNFSKTSNLTVRQNGFFMPGVALVLALPLAAIVAAGMFWYVRRGRKKPKTVSDYDKELNI